jgi:dUTPase
MRIDRSVKVGVKKLVPEAVIPEYAKPGDAGLDLTATSIEWISFGNSSGIRWINLS